MYSNALGVFESLAQVINSGFFIIPYIVSGDSLIVLAQFKNTFAIFSSSKNQVPLGYLQDTSLETISGFFLTKQAVSAKSRAVIGISFAASTTFSAKAS